MQAATDRGFPNIMAADDCGEIVSKFFLESCLYLSQPLNLDKISALVLCTRTKFRPSRDDDEVASIPLLTGSVAEIHIKPMLTCVGDIDIMFHRSDWLAIPEGTPPPTHLPAEFDNRVKVYDILDSEFPGYVYLQSCYLLTECTDDGSYNAVRCPRQYVRYITPPDVPLHGPAAVSDLPRPHGYKSDSAFTFLDHLTAWTRYTAYVVCHGRLKPLIGQHDTETTAGQTQQLSIVLSAMDVMWFRLHIVSVGKMNGWASISFVCHSHEQKLYF